MMIGAFYLPLVNDFINSDKIVQVKILLVKKEGV